MKNIDLNAPATVYAQLPINSQVAAKRYIGSHLSTVTIKDEEYFGSCEDPHFRLDRSNGWLKKVTLYEGTLAECRSLEHQLLVHYNAAFNKEFYNSNNGGGYGVSKDYKHNLSDFHRIIDIVDGKSVVESKVHVNLALADVEAMETLVAEVNSGVYPMKELPVALVSVLAKSQARLFIYNKDNLEDLKIKFTDPTEARKYLTPVSITVDSDGNMVELIDGNHRLKASEHNKWVTIPAYIIPVDKFKGNRQNITHYGNLMNDRKFISAGNSIDDLKKRIAGIAEIYPNIKKDSVGFKRIAIEQLGMLWAHSSIEYYCTDYEKRSEEARLCSNTNFHIYERRELTAYANKLHFDCDVTCAVEVQQISKITGSGLGGILTMMADKKAKKGIVLVHYPSYTDYENRNKYISRVRKALKFFDFEARGYDIEFKFLDPFTKGEIVGLSSDGRRKARYEVDRPLFEGLNKRTPDGRDLRRAQRQVNNDKQNSLRNLLYP